MEASITVMVPLNDAQYIMWVGGKSVNSSYLRSCIESKMSSLWADYSMVESSLREVITEIVGVDTEGGVVGINFVPSFGTEVRADVLLNGDPLQPNTIQQLIAEAVAAVLCTQLRDYYTSFDNVVSVTGVGSDVHAFQRYRAI